MKAVVKVVAATVMVMGVANFANAMGSNTGTVNFTGTIEDSPCSIVVGDEHQTVNLGHIGTGSLMGGKSSSMVNFKIGLENCAFTTETTMSTVFTSTGNESTANPGNVALMRVGGGEMKGSSLIIGDFKGNPIELTNASAQALALDSTGVGQANQQLNFKAWVQGDAAASTIDVGEFNSLVNFTISYL
ncbi:fimbrial major subunit StfA [Citrobacter freundii]|uniref:fimbrial major subunit StfA n=1 Tax=Citrobacter freundii TaxID=546 RepID=UPI0015EABBCD|nr:fimbrial major subunit StfA [Citrobacter freundii]QLR78158.1 fimbrial major subunit StfA [Citrobacter freundii]